MMKQAWLLKMHLKKKKDLSIANSKYTMKNKRFNINTPVFNHYVPTCYSHF